MKNAETGQIMTSNNIKVHPRMKELYKFFKYNGKVMDIIDYDPEIMHIFSRDVLKKIINGDEGWEDMLPKGIPEIIKEEKLFTRKLLKSEDEDKVK
ncbi:hypothetical protein SAMN05421766_102779 [Zobellia uliginosa]|nr:hypothetical protein SAMN05421766_102779 [Zobellia uliginosa]